MEKLNREGLAKRMFDFRAATGMSQRKCAAAAHICLQTWNSVERMQQVPSEITVARIEMLLNSRGKEAAAT